MKHVKGKRIYVSRSERRARTLWWFCGVLAVLDIPAGAIWMAVGPKPGVDAMLYAFVGWVLIVVGVISAIVALLAWLLYR